ncbi:MAG TPA: histidine kinase [Candidatus Merdivicinus excrementipullorum]|uniref:histidine kinase n=1 Tax=Candidatus Merdivicinus excrementipullorum TaxID=2840867 RepID=A0A9D1JZG0_9FIRM|nr:histidine kinase [Candidatus Merdivicinus excrementipullorum]
MKNFDFLRNIRVFSWKSVFFRYLFSLFLLILIIFIPFCIILYQYSDYAFSKELAAVSAQNALKSKTIFDLLNSNYFANCSVVSDSTDVKGILNADTDSIPSQEVARVQDMLQSMKRSDKAVDDLMIYGIQNDLCISTESVRQVGMDRSLSWLNTYRATKLPFLMFPRKVDSDTFDYIYTVSELYDDSGNAIGVFCSKNRYQNFEQVVRQSFGEDPDKIFIVSELGLILYSSDKARINTLMFEDPDIYSAYLSARETEGSTLFWGDHIISVAKSGRSDLILMAYNSRTSLMSGYQQINYFLLTGGLVVFLIAAICSLFIALNHYRSVTSVIRAIQNADEPSRMQLPNRLNSEFFYIINSVISSAQKSQMLDQELVDKIGQLRQAQLSELQAQINPHFIFNTLQLINLSILRETRRDTTATRVISMFSQLMRSTYDTKRMIVPVREEIQNLRLFTDIQSVRYGGRLRSEYDISPECGGFCTLKLMLQPFVENCMLHGFQNAEQDWKLTIRCRLENGFLIFTITDNGAGIEPERLKEIQEKLESPNIQGQNIGITNVRQRLMLLFGAESAVSVESVPGQGTQVTIRHPAMERHPFEDAQQQIS